MYAIIETGGKQYRVETGTLVQVESLPGEVGGTVETRPRAAGPWRQRPGGWTTVGQGRQREGRDRRPRPNPLHHDLQETTAQELSANEWPSPGLYQIAHYRH